jgi:hypothetical protein
VTLIALDDGSKLSGLQRIVENDANGDAADLPGDAEGAGPSKASNRNDGGRDLATLQLLAGSGDAAGARPAPGRRRDARLARQRHGRDGDEPSRPRVHADRGRGRSRPAQLLAVPANYRILFMQGGGLGENAIVPLNLAQRAQGARSISC